MTTTIWKNLVVETQFATELTLSGLRRLCSVPTDPALVQWGSNELNYALHVGMYSYSSGLERLCKLAIACNGYATTGEFPKVRKYSHKIVRKVRWVSTILDVSTYYTSPNLPILGEVVSPTFIHKSADFFNYHIARFSDDAVVEEELAEVYERIHVREAETDSEDFEENGIKV
ncbi:hypothetical protein AB4Y88_21730 [Paenarthrobacter sp. RAF9]